MIQVADIVLRVIPTADRLAVQHGIDRGSMSEDVLRPPRPVETAEQRTFGAVNLAELHTRITMHIFQRPGGNPTTAPQRIFEVNFGLMPRAGRSGGGDYIPVAYDLQAVVGQL